MDDNRAISGFTDPRLRAYWRYLLACQDAEKNPHIRADYGTALGHIEREMERRGIRHDP